MTGYWGWAGAAGLTSAALYLSVVLGSPGAFLLAYLAPLPLFLAGLALGLTALLVAGAAAFVIVGLASGSLMAAGLYLGIEVLPVAVLVRQALLSRPVMAGEEGSGIEWYPLGRLTALLAAMAATVLVIIWLVFAGSEGGLEAAVRTFLNAGLQGMLQAGGAETGEITPAIALMAALFPGIAAASWVVMIAVNGALAQGLASRFGRNLRPSPDMATLELPRALLVALVVAAVVGLVAPGGLGYIGRNLLVVLGMAYLFAGLAVVHGFILKLAARQVLLVVVYVTMVLFGWPVLLVMLLGIVDQLFGLRRRFAGPTQGEE
ncbi:DUF2232 domain-containing protein [Oceanibaculum indicum]|uniref:DUF2232 domain-containing protein n=2 Tax=Oceanibaculum indicum TaxID=526216 RepID=K2J596_9PROT|nr:DUF2232 domain-containing protein [Oceanibaculum indicum]EKE78181.1 hypothetical protein P24_04110 [Oceanibaculum indicum P24]RKQ73630.1 putative membrane protein DUF2232 [Oceanibaculum indicum]